MDELMIRSRPVRHGTYGRRKKYTGAQNQNKLPELILRQTFAAVLILLAAVAVRNMNTPVTNYFKDRIRDMVTCHIEVENIYTGIHNFFNRLMGKEPLDAARKQTGENTLPTDTKNRQDTEAVHVSETFAGFMMPVDGEIITPFGERTHPLKNTREFHNGIDIDADEGSPVLAALSGTVTEIGEDPSYGNFIKIRHANGWTTVYAYCSGIIVEAGDEVRQGDKIAEVGKFGPSSGTHVHFEVWKDETPLNPLDYIQPEQELL